MRIVAPMFFMQMLASPLSILLFLYEKQHVASIVGMVLSMAWVNGSLVAQFYFDSRDADLNQARFDTLHDRRGDFDGAH